MKKILPEVIDKERDLREKKLEYVAVLDKMIHRLGGGQGNVVKTTLRV